jgi:hypothetical protein
MKKAINIWAIALLTSAVATTASAQLYAGVHAGYAMSTAPSVIGTTSTRTTTLGTTGASTVQTSANTYGTSGAGIPVGVNVGYMFSEHFGLDLGLDYFMGSELTTNDVKYTVPYNFGTTAVPVYLPGATQTTAIKAVNKSTQIRVTPSLVVSAGNSGIAPYARFGVVLPVSGETLVNYTNSTQYAGTGVPSNLEEKSTTKVAGNFSVGFNSAVGVNIGLGEKLTLFGEVALTTLSIKGASTDITSYSRVQGSSTLSVADLKAYQKSTTFVDQLTEKSNNSSINSTTTNLDKAKDDVAPTANYNSLGLNVGVRFKF